MQSICYCTIVSSQAVLSAVREGDGELLQERFQLYIPPLFYMLFIVASYHPIVVIVSVVVLKVHCGVF